MTDETPKLYLLPVPLLEDVAGELHAVSRYAIVTPVTVDPSDPRRVLVRVVEGGGMLEDWSTAAVPLGHLMTLAEAQQRLAERRERAAMMESTTAARADRAKAAGQPAARIARPPGGSPEP